MSSLSAEDRYRNFIPDESRQYLEKMFAGFKRNVAIEIYTKEGLHNEYNEFSLKLCRALNVMSDKIELREFAMDSEEGRERKIIASPTILIAPDKYDIRFLGAPAGEEGRALVEALNLASKGEEGISESAMEILGKLKGNRLVKIFSSPSCPYCPGQAINAFKAAVGRPDKVSAWCISTLDNENMARQYNVGSVPHTDINDTATFKGLEPEDQFMIQLLYMKPLKEIMEENRKEPEQQEEKEYEDVDLVIIGGGPAGMSAGIYAKRSGLSCVILEKQGVGGQVALTPKVENYPGFTHIQGFELVEILGAHAREYTRINQFVEVRDIKAGERFEIATDDTVYRAKGILLATGVNVRMLGVPGEDKFYGHGVSYCATCDGNFYRGGKAVVVGGGNTALTDALHLKHLGVETTIIHRRDRFRAEKVLQDSVEREGIKVIWNSEVTEIIGDKQVESVRVKNNEDGSETTLDTDVVFVAIGHTANTSLAQKLGVELREDGFIKVDAGQRTSVERVYAAGDVTGGVRQIIIATGQGAAAALTAFDDFARTFSEEKKMPVNIW
ncbi:FAD-dependent oxidoreductase [Maridesulfovibrio sp.]|uniref:FAD-dependent oxidoreductase n=1 Tax=Maridesulfovibrio sp. TaxID=2795000 RepID=UPI002A18DAC5|nr:FAD-dependent oxidoreductase [Maridesulfovibrio sp.]